MALVTARPCQLPLDSICFRDGEGRSRSGSSPLRNGFGSLCSSRSLPPTSVLSALPSSGAKGEVRFLRPKTNPASRKHSLLCL